MPDLTPSLKAWLWDGTAFTPCAGLPIGDRGFRYGMALFESLRVWQGRALFLDQHLERLRKACQQREFPLPESSLQAAGEWLTSEAPDGFVRVYVTAGEGGITQAVEQPRVLILWEERAAPGRRALRVTLSPQTHRPLFGGLKTANYWANLDALHQARTRGFDEALLFNEHAELVSSAVATVFLQIDGEWRTPALACGARRGVIREWVLQQQPIREGSLFLREVERAEEIFLANSWVGIAPVSSVEKRELAQTTVGERLATVYERLHGLPSPG